MNPPGATTAARTSRRATSDASNATHQIGPSVPESPGSPGVQVHPQHQRGRATRSLPRFDLRKVWEVQKVTGGSLDAVIPGESATPAEPEVRIGCERRGEAARADQRYDSHGGEDSQLLPVSPHLSNPSTSNPTASREPRGVPPFVRRRTVGMKSWRSRNDCGSSSPGTAQRRKRRSDEAATNRTRASQRP